MYLSPDEFNRRQKSSFNLANIADLPSHEGELSGLSESAPENLNSVRENDPINPTNQDVEDAVEAAFANEGRLQVELHKFSGRRAGQANTPDLMRAIIGAAAEIDGVNNTARAFDKPANLISGYRQGHRGNVSDSPQDEKQIALKDAITGEVYDKAIDRLMSSLNLLSDADISMAKAKDKASIAKDMVTIAEKIKPVKKDDGNKGVQILILAPQLRDESHFEVIEAVK